MAVHLLTYVLIMYVFAKGHIKNRHNAELNKKYAPFVRNDIDNWSIIWCFPFYCTFWIRVFLGLLNVCTTPILIWFCMLGIDTKDPNHKISKRRKWWINRFISNSAYFQLVMGGLVWYKVEQVSTDEGDYKKWLGPDWKPEWEGCGTMVSNHVCWMDIVMLLGYYSPSFVSKVSVKDYPGVGKIAIAIDCVFLERAGTKEEKIAVGKMIEDRQV